MFLERGVEEPLSVFEVAAHCPSDTSQALYLTRGKPKADKLEALQHPGGWSCRLRKRIFAELLIYLYIG